MKKIIVIFLILNASYCGAQLDSNTLYREFQFNLHESIMKSTFRISGLDSLGDTIEGTCFLLNKTKSNSQDTVTILITADHVLKDIYEDYITIHYPGIKGNEFRYLNQIVKIRNLGSPLWISLKDSLLDLAAMRLDNLKFQTDSFLDVQCLADEKALRLLQIRPGDKMYCVGFPEGASANEFGFPILKSGVIASYPILPTFEHNYFLFDCELFPASSGSPVYMCESGRYYLSDSEYGFDANLTQAICGIVVSKIFVIEKPDGAKISLQLAKVIPSSYILTLIEKL